MGFFSDEEIGYTTGTGYGSSSSSSGYGYAAPATDYGSSSSDYAAPPTGYGGHSTGYTAPNYAAAPAPSYASSSSYSASGLASSRYSVANSDYSVHDHLHPAGDQQGVGGGADVRQVQGRLEGQLEYDYEQGGQVM